MKLYLVTAVLLLSYTSTSGKEIVRFDNHAVYRFIPKNTEELTVLKTVNDGKQVKCDFWTEPRTVGSPVDIMVPPERKENIEKLISQYNMNYNVMLGDVQKEIEEQRRANLESSNKNLGFGWDKYYTLDEIYAWLGTLVNQYPKIVSLVVGGVTFEGREILGVKVSFSPNNKNRTVWIDSLIRAREWISGATSTYILNQILSSTDPTVRSIAESHDWYIFPVINPDGYVFAGYTNRLWIKTKTYYGMCMGTDANRNWGYKWLDGPGSGSTDPCDNSYVGLSGFSDIETRWLSNFITTIAKDLRVFITLQSYSQQILLPYGYTSEHLDNYNVTNSVGLKAAESLSKRYGTNYTVGSMAEASSLATGSSIDWVKGVHQVPFVYEYQLRDTGKYGYLAPPNEIIPTGEETLDSIITLLQEAEKVSN